MNVRKLSVRLTMFSACLVFMSAVAHAQYRASIQGVVTDPQAAVVSGATVTLQNLQTNQTLTATTDANGIYNFGALPPNQYSLTVEKQGFQKKVLDHVAVIAERRQRDGYRQRQFHSAARYGNGVSRWHHIYQPD